MPPQTEQQGTSQRMPLRELQAEMKAVAEDGTTLTIRDSLSEGVSIEIARSEGDHTCEFALSTEEWTELLGRYH